VEKYDSTGQPTDDSIIRRVRIARYVPKAAITHSEYVTVIAFQQTTMVTRTHHNVTLYVHCLSFTLLHNTKTVRGARTASYSLCTDGSFTGNKRAGV
jgi:hypothetical protein